MKGSDPPVKGSELQTTWCAIRRPPNMHACRSVSELKELTGDKGGAAVEELTQELIAIT